MGANASAHYYPAGKAAAISLSFFLRSAKKSFVSLPRVVSFYTALLYCYRTRFHYDRSFAIQLSIWICLLLFKYIYTVFPSFCVFYVYR